MKKISILLVTIVLFCSCSSRHKDVTLLSLDKITSGQIEKGGINTELRVSIDSDFKKVKIKNVEINLYREDSERLLATIFLNDEIIIKKGVTQIDVPISLKINGGIFGALVIGKLWSDEKDKLFVEVKGEIKKGVIPIKISFDRRPLKEMFKLLGADKIALDDFF